MAAQTIQAAMSFWVVGFRASYPVAVLIPPFVYWAGVVIIWAFLLGERRARVEGREKA